MRKLKTLMVGVVALVLTGGLAACGHSAGTPGASAPATAASTARAPVDAASLEGAPATTPTASTSKLKITSYGPQGTKAGLVFNKQPNGSAAIWIRMNWSMAGDTVSVDFNGAPLTGDISGNLVTAAIPASLYARAGTYKIHVAAQTSTGVLHSNSVKFTVQ